MEEKPYKKADGNSQLQTVLHKHIFDISKKLRKIP